MDFVEGGNFPGTFGEDADKAINCARRLDGADNTFSIRKQIDFNHFAGLDAEMPQNIAAKSDLSTGCDGKTRHGKLLLE